jgi:hypothetical protein
MQMIVARLPLDIAGIRKHSSLFCFCRFCECRGILPHELLHAHRPCDVAFGGEKEYAEALRGVLNTGHRRGGTASCCVGQCANITFKDFSTLLCWWSVLLQLLP